LIAKEDVAWSAALSLSLEAGLAAASSDVASATERLAAAARAYRQLEMHLHAAAADLERSRLLDGDEGRALLASAESWMIEAHVARSERIAAMLIPGIGA